MSGLDFIRIHHRLPIDPAAVSRLLGRLSQPDSPRPLVLETRADDAGIRFFVGTSRDRLAHTIRLLEQHLDGVRAERCPDREPVVASGRVTVSPNGLPLDTDASEQTIYNLYGAFASRRDGESLVLQLSLGRGHRPSPVPRGASDPRDSLLSALLRGSQPAPAEVRSRLRFRAEQPSIGATVRLGVAAATPARRQALILEMLGALRTLEAPGVHVGVVRETAAALNDARPGRQSELATSELVALMGWPLGDGHLPGMPGLHPKQLPPPAVMPTRGSVFATATTPGDERPIRLDPLGRLQHLVATGPTGSGKSMVIARLALEDVREGRACVLVDPKRQLVDFIIDRIPEERTGEIVVLDAADASPVGFNPLDTEGRNTDVVVDGILAVFKAVFEDGWGPRTEDLLHAGLLTLARAGETRGLPYTLLDLPTLLTDASFRRSVVGAVAADPTMSSFWAAYDELSPGARANIIAAPMNKLRKYVLRRGLAAVLGQPRPAFRLRDVFREGRTVLVPLNDALLGPGAAQLLGSLVVAEVWLATLERAAEPDPTIRPAAIYIDEVQQFLHLPTSIADALATSRSYGVSWNFAHQYRKQLPSQMRAAFDANARNKIVFACDTGDANDFARMSSGLAPADFQALPPYEIYARIVYGGAQSGWFSARTLPPDSSLGRRQAVLAASRARYGANQTTTSRPPEPTVATPPNTAAGHRKERRR